MSPEGPGLAEVLEVIRRQHAEDPPDPDRILEAAHEELREVRAARRAQA